MQLSLPFMEGGLARQTSPPEQPVPRPTSPGKNPPPRPAAAGEPPLADCLRAYLPQLERLTLTDNTSTMISAKPTAGGSYRVRLHRMFATASPGVLKALATYIRGANRQSASTVRRFIAEQRHLIRRPPRRRRSAGALRTKGRYVDLQALYHDINRRYFGDQLQASITWGRRNGGRGPRASIRFGSYSAAENLIRIHPALDQPFVPAYFLQALIHHEMLHKHLGVQARNGRRIVHSPQFRALERRFPEYARARRWEKANLRRLIKS